MPATITATVEDGAPLSRRSRFSVRVEVEEQERPRLVHVYAEQGSMIVDVDDAAWDALYDAGLTPMQTLSVEEVRA